MTGELSGVTGAVGLMMTERGMVALAAGGSVLAAVPELAGRVQTTVFDADTGRLDVGPRRYRRRSSGREGAGGVVDGEARRDRSGVMSGGINWTVGEGK